MATPELIALQRAAVPSEHIRAYFRTIFEHPKRGAVARDWAWREFMLEARLDETMFLADAAHLISCRLLLGTNDTVLVLSGRMRVVPIVLGRAHNDSEI